VIPDAFVDGLVEVKRRDRDVARESRFLTGKDLIPEMDARGRYRRLGDWKLGERSRRQQQAMRCHRVELAHQGPSANRERNHQIL